jgi:hypothetical protein
MAIQWETNSDDKKNLIPEYEQLRDAINDICIVCKKQGSICYDGEEEEEDKAIEKVAATTTTTNNGGVSLLKTCKSCAVYSY